MAATRTGGVTPSRAAAGAAPAAHATATTTTPHTSAVAAAAAAAAAATHKEKRGGHRHQQRQGLHHDDDEAVKPRTTPVAPAEEDEEEEEESNSVGAVAGDCGAGIMNLSDALMSAWTVETLLHPHTSPPKFFELPSPDPEPRSSRTHQQQHTTRAANTPTATAAAASEQQLQHDTNTTATLEEVLKRPIIHPNPHQPHRQTTNADATATKANATALQQQQQQHHTPYTPAAQKHKLAPPPGIEFMASPERPRTHTPIPTHTEQQHQRIAADAAPVPPQHTTMTLTTQQHFSQAQKRADTDTNAVATRNAAPAKAQLQQQHLHMRHQPTAANLASAAGGDNNNNNTLLQQQRYRFSRTIHITPTLIARFSGIKNEKVFYNDVTHVNLAYDVMYPEKNNSKESQTAADKHRAATAPARKDAITSLDGLNILRQLQSLTLSGHAISKIGHHHLRSSARTLRVVDLANNQLAAIEGIFALRALEVLDVSGNRITRIPKQMGELRALQILAIARNRISILRDLEHLAPCSNLTDLDIDDNPVTAIAHCRAFAIYSVPTLCDISGHTVSVQERDAARQRFVHDSRFNGEDELQAQRAMSENLRLQVTKSESALEDAHARIRALETQLQSAHERYDTLAADLAAKSSLLDQKSDSYARVSRDLAALQQEFEFYKIDHTGVLASPGGTPHAQQQQRASGRPTKVHGGGRTAPQRKVRRRRPPRPSQDDQDASVVLMWLRAESDMTLGSSGVGLSFYGGEQDKENISTRLTGEPLKQENGQQKQQQPVTETVAAAENVVLGALCARLRHVLVSKESELESLIATCEDLDAQMKEAKEDVVRLDEVSKGHSEKEKALRGAVDRSLVELEEARVLHAESKKVMAPVGGDKPVPAADVSASKRTAARLYARVVRLEKAHARCTETLEAFLAMSRSQTQSSTAEGGDSDNQDGGERASERVATMMLQQQQCQLMADDVRNECNELRARVSDLMKEMEATSALSSSYGDADHERQQVEFAVVRCLLDHVVKSECRIVAEVVSKKTVAPACETAVDGPSQTIDYDGGHTSKIEALEAELANACERVRVAEELAMQLRDNFKKEQESSVSHVSESEMSRALIVASAPPEMSTRPGNGAMDGEKLRLQEDVEELRGRHKALVESISDLVPKQHNLTVTLRDMDLQRERLEATVSSLNEEAQRLRGETLELEARTVERAEELERDIDAEEQQFLSNREEANGVIARLQEDISDREAVLASLQDEIRVQETIRDTVALQSRHNGGTAADAGGGSSAVRADMVDVAVQASMIVQQSAVNAVEAFVASGRSVDVEEEALETRSGVSSGSEDFSDMAAVRRRVRSELEMDERERVTASRSMARDDEIAGLRQELETMRADLVTLRRHRDAAVADASAKVADLQRQLVAARQGFDAERQRMVSEMALTEAMDRGTALMAPSSPPPKESSSNNTLPVSPLRDPAARARLESVAVALERQRAENRRLSKKAELVTAKLAELKQQAQLQKSISTAVRHEHDESRGVNDGTAVPSAGASARQESLPAMTLQRRVLQAQLTQLDVHIVSKKQDLQLIETELREMRHLFAAVKSATVASSPMGKTSDNAATVSLFDSGVPTPKLKEWLALNEAERVRMVDAIHMLHELEVLIESRTRHLENLTEDDARCRANVKDLQLETKGLERALKSAQDACAVERHELERIKQEKISAETDLQRLVMQQQEQPCRQTLPVKGHVPRSVEMNVSVMDAASIRASDDQMSARVFELEQRCRRAEDSLAEAQQARERVEADLQMQSARVLELDARLIQVVTTDLGVTVSEEVVRAREELAHLQEEVETEKLRASRAREASAEAQASLEAVAHAVESLQSKVASVKSVKAEIAERNRALRDKGLAIEKDIKELKIQYATTASSKDQVDVGLAQAQATLAAVEKRTSEAQEQCDTASAKLVNVQTDVTEAERRRAELAEACLEAETKYAEVMGQVSAAHNDLDSMLAAADDAKERSIVHEEEIQRRAKESAEELVAKHQDLKAVRAELAALQREADRITRTNVEAMNQSVALRTQLSAADDANRKDAAAVVSAQLKADRRMAFAETKLQEARDMEELVQSRMKQAEDSCVDAQRRVAKAHAEMNEARTREAEAVFRVNEAEARLSEVEAAKAAAAMRHSKEFERVGKQLEALRMERADAVQACEALKKKLENAEARVREQSAVQNILAADAKKAIAHELVDAQNELARIKMELESTRAILAAQRAESQDVARAVVGLKRRRGEYEAGVEKMRGEHEAIRATLEAARNAANAWPPSEVSSSEKQEPSSVRSSEANHVVSAPRPVRSVLISSTPTKRGKEKRVTYSSELRVSDVTNSGFVVSDSGAVMVVGDTPVAVRQGGGASPSRSPAGQSEVDVNSAKLCIVSDALAEVQVAKAKAEAELRALKRDAAEEQKLLRQLAEKKADLVHACEASRRNLDVLDDLRGRASALTKQSQRAVSAHEPLSRSPRAVSSTSDEESGTEKIVKPSSASMNGLQKGMSQLQAVCDALVAKLKSVPSSLPSSTNGKDEGVLQNTGELVFLMRNAIGDMHRIVKALPPTADTLYACLALLARALILDRVVLAHVDGKDTGYSSVQKGSHGSDEDVLASLRGEIQAQQLVFQSRLAVKEADLSKCERDFAACREALDAERLQTVVVQRTTGMSPVVSKRRRRERNLKKSIGVSAADMAPIFVVMQNSVKHLLSETERLQKQRKELGRMSDLEIALRLRDEQIDFLLDHARAVVHGEESASKSKVASYYEEAVANGNIILRAARQAVFVKSFEVTNSVKAMPKSPPSYVINNSSAKQQVSAELSVDKAKFALFRSPAAATDVSLTSESTISPDTGRKRSAFQGLTPSHVRIRVRRRPSHRRSKLVMDNDNDASESVENDASLSSSPASSGDDIPPLHDDVVDVDGEEESVSPEKRRRQEASKAMRIPPLSSPIRTHDASSDEGAPCDSHGVALLTPYSTLARVANTLDRALTGLAFPMVVSAKKKSQGGSTAHHDSSDDGDRVVDAQKSLRKEDHAGAADLLPPLQSESRRGLLYETFPQLLHVKPEQRPLQSEPPSHVQYRDDGTQTRMWPRRRCESAWWERVELDVQSVASSSTDSVTSASTSDSE